MTITSEVVLEASVGDMDEEGCVILSTRGSSVRQMFTLPVSALPRECFDEASLACIPGSVIKIRVCIDKGVCGNALKK